MQWCRAVGAGGTGDYGPPKFWPDQSTLSQPGGGHIMSTTLLLAPPPSYGPVVGQSIWDAARWALYFKVCQPPLWTVS